MSIQCKACKYKGEIYNEAGVSPITNPKFIEISGVRFVIEDTTRFNNYKEVRLYACPKCGTVRMEEY